MFVLYHFQCCPFDAVYNFKICRSSASDAKISWSVRPKGEFGADLKGIVFDYNGQRQAANVSEGGAVFGGLTAEEDHEVRATLTWEQSYFFTSDTAHVGTIQQSEDTSTTCRDRTSVHYPHVYM